MKHKRMGEGFDNDDDEESLEFEITGLSTFCSRRLAKQPEKDKDHKLTTLGDQDHCDSCSEQGLVSSLQNPQDPLIEIPRFVSYDLVEPERRRLAYGARSRK